MNFYLKGLATNAAFLLILLISICTGVFAQGYQATLDGQITDGTGAVVAGAKITVKNTQTGAISITVSGSDGYYHVGYLNPGTYSVVVEKLSFETSVHEGIQLEVAQSATIDFKLSPGNAVQSVTVTGQPAQLETETADQGATVDEQRMLTLPTQGHNPIAAAFSVPGVIVTTADQRLRAFDTSGSTGMSINGSPSGGMNETLVDGLTSLEEASTVAYVPTAEATSELRVQTTNFDAEYGWTLGGVVNMITKSGTNNFHGAAWEYFQNTIFDANNFNGNYTGTPRTTSHVNTFGADFGGPIRKNKIFFNYTYEDLRQVIPNPFVASVPTARQKTGDFSQTYYAPGQLDIIYDPLTTITEPDGTLVRTQFPGNVIPTPRLDPVAVKVLSYIPGGDTPGNSVTGLNNLTNNSNSRKFTDYFPENTVRVDYDMNLSTRLFVRYSRNALQEERNFYYSTVSAINPADPNNNNPFTRENHNATIQLTKILNPTTVLDLRFGFERYKTEDGNQQGAGIGPSTLGFSPTYAGQAANWFPAFSWANYQGAGALPTYFSAIAYTYDVQSLLSKTKGPFDLKFGVDLRLLRGNMPNPGYDAGDFTFNQEFTGANPLAIEPSSGNAIASFLLGTPASGYIQKNSEPARQEKMVSLFAQNDIRLSERLKLNLGVRWDYLGPLTDRFNGLATFNPEAVNPLQVPGQTLYGGLVFAGVNGNARGIYNQSWGNFGPRAGVSYKLDNNTVLHGGYALLFGQTWNDPGEAPGFSQTTNMVTSIQAGIPYNTLDNPFPAGILSPSGSSQGLETDLGQSFSFADPNGKIPEVQQFSLGVQRQLGKDFMLSASYVGSQFSRLPVTQQINAIPLSAVGLGETALTQSVANPFAGLIPGSALNNATVQRQQLLAPYPQFLVNGITEMFEPIGTSSYNAGQFLVSKRLSNGQNIGGLDFTVEYTISKQLTQNIYANPQDTYLQKNIAAWDIPRNLQINLLWQLPFGAGQAYGANLTKPARWAISGWSASSLTRLQAGMPLNLSGTNSVPIPNVSQALPHPTYAQWFNSCTQLSNGLTQNCVGSEQPAWTVRQADTLQTWATLLSGVRLPGVHNSDISLIKNNQVTERLNLIFRTDFVNAFNSPQFFNGPISNVTSASFGQIAGAMDQSNLPRFAQFSLKAQF